LDVSPNAPSIAGSVPSQITLCQVGTNDGIPKIVQLGWGAPSICMKNLYLVLGVGKYGYQEYFYNHYAGVAALAGNKRRRKDLKDEATQAESINCIAQRLAKMPSPLSSKWVYRMATMAEITNPMEEIDADVPEITGLWEQFDQTGVTNEVMQTSGYTQVSFFFKVSKITTFYVIFLFAV